MSTYYRWFARGPDLDAVKSKSLQVSASQRTACWIFDMSDYVPSAGVHGDRVLVAIVLNQRGDSILADRSKWIRFPGVAFKGEAQHPDKVIVKSNEPGAYGVGQSMLKELAKCIREVRLANREEMAKALGKAIPQSQIDIRMQQQKW
jgi:hypothetical protein